MHIYTLEDLKQSVFHEIAVIKHLYEKIPAGAMDFRPTPGQRSTLELLQYLSYVGAACTLMILKNDTSVFTALAEEGKAVTAETFLQAMDKQKDEMESLFSKFDEKELSTVVNLYGMGEKTKGVYLVEMVGKFFSAYKLQLFLYSKLAGNDAIGTSNLWGGFDMPTS